MEGEDRRRSQTELKELRGEAEGCNRRPKNSDRAAGRARWRSDARASAGACSCRRLIPEAIHAGSRPGARRYRSTAGDKVGMRPLGVLLPDGAPELPRRRRQAAPGAREMDHTTRRIR